MIYRSGVDAPTAQIQYTNVTDREANIFGYIRNPSLGSCIDRVLSQSAFLFGCSGCSFFFFCLNYYSLPMFFIMLVRFARCRQHSRQSNGLKQQPQVG